MKLIDPSDPLYFQQSSNGLYDRHHYKLVFSDGRDKIYESWEGVQSTWFQTATQFLSHVEVLDIKTKQKSKGFS